MRRQIFCEPSSFWTEESVFMSIMVSYCVCLLLNYYSTFDKAVRVGGGGEWRTCARLRETTSRGRCGLGCPSRTSERGGDCVKEGGGGEGERERERALGLLL